MGYDPEGTWDRSVHRNLSKGSKYYKKSYRLSVEWNYNTDYFPLKSDEKVSAPFHSRKNSLKIAKKLYNLSMKVLKTKLLCRFGFIDNRSDNFFPNNDTILPLFLKYKTNSSGNQLNTHSTEHDFLNIINLKTTNVKVNYKNQSLVLLGLALHTIQDYFAHVIPICAKAYNKKGKEIHYSICESMTAFNHELKGVSTIDIEDNTEFIKWRFKETKKITNSMYKFFKKRLYIKK